MELNNKLITQRRDLSDELHKTIVSLKEKEYLLKDYAELGNQLEVLKRSSEEKSRQNDELQLLLNNSREELKKLIDTLNSQNETISDIQVEDIMNSPRMENSESTVATNNYSKNMQNLKISQRKLKIFETDIIKLKETINTLTEQKNILADNNPNQKQSLLLRIESYKAEMLRLHESIKKKDQHAIDLDSTIKESNKNIHSKVQHLMDQSQMSSDALKIKSDHLELVKQELGYKVELNNKLITQSDVLKDELHKMSVSLAEKEEILKDYDEIKSKLEILQTSSADRSRENAELNMMLKSSTTQVGNQIVTIKNQKITIANIQAELDDIICVNTSLQTQMVDNTNLLNRQTVDSTELLNKYRREIENLNECRNNNLTEINSLKIENKIMTNDIMEVRSDNEERKEKNLENSKLISKLEENILLNTIDLKKLEYENNGRIQNILQITEKLNDADLKFRDKCNECNELLKKREHESGVIEQITVKLLNMEQQINFLNGELSNYKTQVNYKLITLSQIMKLIDNLITQNVSCSISSAIELTLENIAYDPNQNTFVLLDLFLPSIHSFGKKIDTLLFEKTKLNAYLRTMEKSLTLGEQIRNELETAITTSDLENNQYTIRIHQLETECLVEKNKGEKLRIGLDSLQFELETLRNLIKMFNENGCRLPNAINDSIFGSSLSSPNKSNSMKTTDSAINQLEIRSIDNTQWTLIYHKLISEIERLKEMMEKMPNTDPAVEARYVINL
jgi:chromosome segregation ATPase